MLSFERMGLARQVRAGWLGLACGLLACLLAACELPAPRPAPADPVAARCDPPDGSLPAARRADLAALRAAVERGPLFVAVGAGRPASCTVLADGSQWQLDYRFADNATLRVTRDTRIEYTDLTAHVMWPAASDPRDLLQRAERASFAPAGCGIDWQQPAESSATTQVWRGDVCQCQARVQRDTSGHVVALGLRSAC